jgi:tetratricopeptide (TPR) repeat protein
VQQSVSVALEIHQTGRLETAARLYQQILVQEQENSDALHLLGVLRHQQGNHSAAVELIRRAISLRPNTPAYHANLAEAYRALGQFERAVGCCRVALRLWPDFPEALGNLGVALQSLNRHDEAIEHFQRALRVGPGTATTHSNVGISLRRLERRDEALIHFQRAVELDPGSASARTNLGLLLLDLGRAAEALPHCQESIRLEPDTAVLHHNLGSVFRALNRLTEARSAYTEALTLDPDLAIAHAHLGLILHLEGQLAEALPWMRQAVELKPDDADLWEQLADLHMSRELSGEAVPCYERALALKPERASTHNALGRALQDDGKPGQAEEHYRAAERLKPDMPVTQLNLGDLHEERGELVEAEACYRESLRRNSAYALPQARLATLLRGKLGDAERLALESRLSELKANDEPSATLLFGMAQVLDGRGEYARAAECLHEANSLTLEFARKFRRGYEPASHDEFVDYMMKVSRAGFFARTAGGGVPGRRPVFVFGLPRSGTTLVEQILASHSRVHGAGELVLVRRSFDAIPGLLGRSEWPTQCLEHLDGLAVSSLAQQHLLWLREHDAGKSERIVDKMPDNYLYLGLIAAMFPDAVLIHCRRDLRDVAVSCWMTNFRSIRWSNDIEHIATRFAAYRRVMEHWRMALPSTIHEVEYEDTVSNLEGVARRLIAACGLEWEPACLDFHSTPRVVRTASVAQVRQPIYTRSVARWRNYENDLSDLFARLAAL